MSKTKPVVAAWEEYVKNIEKAKSLVSGAPGPDCLRAAQLKELLSGINNLATRILEMEFINWLGSKGLLDDSAADSAREGINETSANGNGYDIVLSDGKIVAEVKFMIPCVDGGKQYGSQQAEGIIKDLKGLMGLEPKGKAKKQIYRRAEWEQYIKFMVLLNTEAAISAFNEIAFVKKNPGSFNIVNTTNEIAFVKKNSGSFNIVNTTGENCEQRKVNILFLPVSKN